MRSSRRGEYSITLRNEGEELHEFVLVRLADEETPLEELIASEEEPKLTDIAFSFACPGANAEPTAATIDEPGRYVAVCVIPVGTTGETALEDFETMGPPRGARHGRGVHHRELACGGHCGSRASVDPIA